MQTHRPIVAALAALATLSAIAHATQLPLPELVTAFVAILRAIATGTSPRR